MLVDDALIQGPGFEEDNEGLSLETFQISKRFDRLVQKLRRKNVSSFRFDYCSKLVRQVVHRIDVVHRPDHPVAIVLCEVGRREVQCHQRRIGPVEQSSWQPVVLTQREPEPKIARRVRTLRVFDEVPEQVTFEMRFSKSVEGCAEIVGLVCQTAVDVRRAVTMEVFRPRVMIQRIMKFGPGLNSNYLWFHRKSVGA